MTMELRPAFSVVLSARSRVSPCAFPQRTLGKSVSSKQEPLANVKPYSSGRIGMNTQDTHLVREQLTMTKMVGIYCADHHDSPTPIPCATCQEFLDYANVRLAKCPYGDDKPTCAKCPIHCYKPVRREQVRTIMRYAGPRMLLHHPLLAITHQLDGFRKARHPRQLTREQRMAPRKD
jgi:hypothetical protein